MAEGLFPGVHPLLLRQLRIVQEISHIRIAHVQPLSAMGPRGLSKGGDVIEAILGIRIRIGWVSLLPRGRAWRTRKIRIPREVHVGLLRLHFPHQDPPLQVQQAAGLAA